jgi:hypothetical protein
MFVTRSRVKNLYIQFNEGLATNVRGTGLVSQVSIWAEQRQQREAVNALRAASLNDISTKEKMKSLPRLALSLAFFCVFGGSVFSSSAKAAETAVLGFQAWKTSRVDDARSNLEKLQAEKPSQALAAITGPKPSDKKNQSEQARAMALRVPRTDQKVQQAQLALEIAQELTINDYFVLYLGPFKNNRDAYIEAAKKLSPEESADLMMSYQKRLIGSSEADEPTPTSASLSNAQSTSTKR